MSNTKMNANSPESNRKRQLPESFLLLGLGIWKVTETKELFQLPTDQSGQNVVLFVFLPLQTLHICLKNRAWHVGVWPEHVSPVCTRLKTLLLLCLTIELPITAFFQLTSPRRYLSFLYFLWGFENLEEIDPEKSQTHLSQERVVNIILPNGSLTYPPHWQNEQNQK